MEQLITLIAPYIPENTDFRFYGIAGIQRATNSDEDEIIKNILLNQSV